MKAEIKDGNLWRARDLKTNIIYKLGPKTLAQVQSVTEPQDPETALRELWTAQGVTKERQDQLIAEIDAKAQPGAKIGPFTIGQPALF